MKRAEEQINSSDLNHPQTAVWEFEGLVTRLFFRKDLNDPQTAVWGIFAFSAKPLRNG